jgi:OOP family OmpA-OmpF porin
MRNPFPLLALLLSSSLLCSPWVATADPDRDGDGLPDASDKCPTDPEDLDGFQDTDGCPDPDNDADSIPDMSDMCPNDPEDFDHDQDTDGCPDHVILRPDHAPTYVEYLYFDAKAHKLAPEHDATLQAVAAALKDHPEIKKVRIEGHSDPCGHEKTTSAFNVSQRRADTVLKALIDLGIDPTRLEAIGYGSERPIIDVSSLSGQARLDACAKQRRVQFTILPDAAP